MTEEIQEAVDQEVEAQPEPEQTPEPPKREWSDEDAEEAKAFGWKSPDEWEGEKPAGYIDDPRRYLERAENFRPFKALKERLSAKEREFDERIRKLDAIAQQAVETQKRQHEAELAEIKRQKSQAVELADRDAYEALVKREEKLTAPIPQKPAQPPAPQIDPVVLEYRQKADWAQNPLLWKTAVELVDANHDIQTRPAKEQLDYAEREIRRMYPAYFVGSQPPEPSVQPSVQRVDGGGIAGGSLGKSSGFDKLPAEAKQAFKKFVADGLFADTEAGKRRYVDDYNAA